MKALSIQQPWAWLIVHGHKPIENRTWNTGFRGPFLVHAGKTFDRPGYEWVRESFPHIPLPAPSEFERGGIVGMANLLDCVAPFSDLDETPAFPWYADDYGFLLGGAKALPFVPLKGMLGFFSVPESVSNLCLPEDA